MGARTVLIMGPPGAGKGTQAAHLVEAYQLRHVATGDVLREAVAAGTELGREAKSYMDSGGLVPDQVIIGMLKELIMGLGDGDGVLLDGFPRTLPQAEALEPMLTALGREIEVVLDVRVPTEILIERLSGRWICRSCQTPYNVSSNPPAQPGVCDKDGGELYQREDDKAEAVAHRLEVYAQDTAPVSAFYDEKGVRRVIDGNQPLSDVQAALDSELAATAR